jgi:hypothetical protein
MSPYATPRLVTDPAECYFYHSIELPGLGVMPGTWDLRDGLDDYLGYVSFEDRRVLDVGAANGLLSFHVESRGAADVVGIDLDPTHQWDLVPFAGWTELAATRPGHAQMIERLNNAYWLGHRLLGSRARVVYSTAYTIPERIGPVDIAVYGSVLLHLRDPFLALERGLRLTRELVIVTEVLRGQTVPTAEPYLGFLPDGETCEPKDTWWDLRPELIVRILRVLGFGDPVLTCHRQLFGSRPIELYTVVARRVQGAALGA